jgi:uncharacterized membrane protein YkgB
VDCLTTRGGQFAPEHNLLLVSSWNHEVRMYDVLVVFIIIIIIIIISILLSPWSSSAASFGCRSPTAVRSAPISCHHQCLSS